jgi:hypothetical protein
LEPGASASGADVGGLQLKSTSSPGPEKVAPE